MARPKIIVYQSGPLKKKRVGHHCMIRYRTRTVIKWRYIIQFRVSPVAMRYLPSENETADVFYEGRVESILVVVWIFPSLSHRARRTYRRIGSCQKRVQEEPWANDGTSVYLLIIIVVESNLKTYSYNFVLQHGEIL